jgi:hypothetical protein
MPDASHARCQTPGPAPVLNWAGRVRRGSPGARPGGTTASRCGELGGIYRGDGLSLPSQV